MINLKSGAMIASAAAALVAAMPAGAVEPTVTATKPISAPNINTINVPNATPNLPAPGTTAVVVKASTVKCAGINSCKGKGECASATNGCLHMNGCKYKGWVTVSPAECSAQKGTVVADKDPPKVSHP